MKTYKMVIARFSIQDKTCKFRFFEETFLLANTSMDVILGMSFLVLSNANILFNTESFISRIYSAADSLPTAKYIKFINRHKFTKDALNKNSKTFVVYIIALEALKPALHQFLAPLLAVL